jgi:hypothetical protein
VPIGTDFGFKFAVDSGSALIDDRIAKLAGGGLDRNMFLWARAIGVT